MRSVLFGYNHRTLPIPWFIFTRILRNAAKKTKAIPGNLDDEHRQVHHFAVRMLPGLARPMPPDYIAGHPDLDLARVIRILGGLKRRLLTLAVAR